MYEKIDAFLNEDEAVSDWKVVDDGWVFKLKNIDTEITIILAVNPLRGGYNFWQSHFIHTPTQIGPYMTSRPWGDDLEYALHLALTSITSYYNQAIKESHYPSPEWLVKNELGI